MGGESTTKLTDLPTEIIERIFDFSPLYQRAILLQVCRALSHPCFWQCTYRTISLYDIHQLHSFADTIELEDNVYSKVFLGESVRHMTLWRTLLDTGTNAVEFLQQHCPNVECLELTAGPDSHKDPPPCIIPQYTCCDLKMIYSSLFDNWEESILYYEKQLTHLSLTSPFDFDLTFYFPHLTHIDYRPQLLIHSLEEMDQINRSCPALQYLHMGDLDVSWDYDAMIKAMDPLASLSSLTHLEMGQVYFSDPVMGQIFGVFYPNLTSLKIQHLRAKAISAVIPIDIDGTLLETASEDDDDYSSDFDDFDIPHGPPSPPIRRHHHTWPEMVQCLNQIMANLPCLRQLHLPSIGFSPCSEEWSPDDPWLQNFAELEDIRLDWYCKSFKTYGGLTDKRPEPKWERVSHLLDLCQDTIQSWHLFLKHDPVSTQRTIFERLVQCRWLNSLIIHTTYESDTTLPIDELLSCLPHLKSLELQTQFGKDLLSPIEKTAPRLRSLDSTNLQPHDLYRFVYIGKIYSSRLMAYVHARCPRLSVLHLDGRQTPSKKKVTLELTGWRLKELDIGSEFSVGKMVKTVLVQETSYSPSRSRWFQFSRGSWSRQRQTGESQSASANLTIICDYIERCVVKPQDPLFIQTP